MPNLDLYRDTALVVVETYIVNPQLQRATIGCKISILTSDCESLPIANPPD